MTLTARARLLVAVAGVVLLGVACVPLLAGPQIPTSDDGSPSAGIQCRSIADGTGTEDVPASQSVSREEVLDLDGSDRVHEDAGLLAPDAYSPGDPAASEEDRALADLAALAGGCPDARISNLVVTGALVVPAVLLLAVALLAAAAPPTPGGRERLPYRYVPMGRRDADR